MIRPLQAANQRYDHKRKAGGIAYGRASQWGREGAGPERHRIHLEGPRDVVPESNMPAYPWLTQQAVDPATVPPRLRAMQRLGVPYSDAEIAASAAAVKGKTELDALVAYLKSLGTHVK